MTTRSLELNALERSRLHLLHLLKDISFIHVDHISIHNHY